MFIVMKREPPDGADHRHPLWMSRGDDERFAIAKEAMHAAETDSRLNPQATVAVRDDEENVFVCAFRNGKTIAF